MLQFLHQIGKNLYRGVQTIYSLKAFVNQLNIEWIVKAHMKKDYLSNNTPKILLLNSWPQVSNYATAC
jgi:hypothetical protein